jgi:acylphosphatase
MERTKVVFRGRVQGVGFRYTTYSVASQYEVSGYVKNLRTGDVELVAEGRPDELERFLAAVEQAMQRNIVEARREKLAASGEFEGFEVR